MRTNWRNGGNLKENLGSLIPALRIWNKVTFGNIEQKKKETHDQNCWNPEENFE